MVLEFFVVPTEGNEVIAGAIKGSTPRLSEYGPRTAEDGPCKSRRSFQGLDIENL